MSQLRNRMNRRRAISIVAFGTIAMGLALTTACDRRAPETRDNHPRRLRLKAPKLSEEDREPFRFLVSFYNPPSLLLRRPYQTLKSFMTPDEVRTTLRIDDWIVVIDRELGGHGICPAHRTLRVEIPDFVHGPATGVLTLTFKNERLQTTAFGPKKKLGAYIAFLRKHGTKIDPRGAASMNDGFTMVTVRSGNVKKAVVSEDVRLREELFRLSRRCAKQRVIEEIAEMEALSADG